MAQEPENHSIRENSEETSIRPDRTEWLKIHRQLMSFFRNRLTQNLHEIAAVVAGSLGGGIVKVDPGRGSGIIQPFLEPIQLIL